MKTEKEIEIVEEVEGYLDKDQALEITQSQTTLSREVAELKVTSKESYDNAIHIGIQNKHRIDQLENLRLAIVAPFKKHLKKIDDFFKALAMPFENNDGALREKIKKYQMSLKKPEAIQNRYIDDGSRATVSMVMKFRIVDEKLVPRQYLKIDESKIGREVRGRAESACFKDDKGKWQSRIPGIDVFEEPQTSFVPEK